MLISDCSHYGEIITLDILPNDVLNDQLSFFHSLLLGENVFFNQVNAMHGSYTLTNYPEVWRKVSFKKMPYHTLFGDGTEIPDDYIQVSGPRKRLKISVFAPKSFSIFIF